MAIRKVALEAAHNFMSTAGKWLGLLLCGLLAACAPDYQKPLTVGTNVWTGNEPLYLARNLGYYDERRLRLVELSSSAQSMDALRSGRLDGASLTLDEALTLASEGVPLRVVWVLDVSAGADAVLGRPGVETLADLRGRRIGVEQTATGAYLLDAALHRAGLTAADVDVVPLPVDAHVEEFRQGNVDALVTFDPARQLLLGEGARALFDSRQLPGEIVDVLVVRDDALECCAGDIRRLIAGQQRALAYLARHREDALARMATRLGLSPADVAQSLSGLVLPDTSYNQTLLGSKTPALQASAQRQAELMQRHGLLATALDTRGLLDGRFTREEAAQ